MLKKISLQILGIAAILLFISTTNSLAQTRIRLGSENSATVSGSLAAKESREYLIRVRKNEEIFMEVFSGNGDVTNEIIGNGEDIGIEYLGDQHYKALTTGDYRITLRNSGQRRTGYKLTVTVE